MYSLDCSYFKEEFETLDELIDRVMYSGMDPSYEITKNGVGTGELLEDFLMY